MRNWLWGSALWALGLTLVLAQPLHARSDGDGDPFPLSCSDFSGSWRADSGMHYQIEQRGCAWLRIQAVYGADDQESLTIVPDNRLRILPGYQKGVVRHRWNSPKNGTAIESHRTLSYKNRRVTELVTLEQVSLELLLESVYRTIEDFGPGKPQPKHEYEQEIFRRQAPGNGLPPPKRDEK